MISPDEKYAVFENYQRVVHQEPPGKISPSGFERFLCGSPLIRRTEVGPDGKEKMLGSFHQCYRLDGQLVAIGVLDLLPDCVSTVYFLYHESIHSFAPGKLGAMREIALAREGGYRWWYPEYYIHNCPKMRYKIDYSPQYVLDPETLAWDHLNPEVLSIFDRKPYVSLSRYRSEQEEEDQGGGSGEPPAELPTQADTELEQGSEEAPDSDEDMETSFLLTSNFPGIPSLEEMEGADLDGLMVRFDAGLYPASALRVWETETIREPGSLKAVIAELAAAVGLDLLDKFCLDFRRHAHS